MARSLHDMGDDVVWVGVLNSARVLSLKIRTLDDSQKFENRICQKQGKDFKIREKIL